MFYKKYNRIKASLKARYLPARLEANPFINKDMLIRGSVQTLLRCQQ
ncbi:conserved hypothetical protein [Klebsiella variicola]|nr:conserved hypothetical protein [Klebsiella variicola]